MYQFFVRIKYLYTTIPCLSIGLEILRPRRLDTRFSNVPLFLVFFCFLIGPLFLVCTRKGPPQEDTFGPRVVRHQNRIGDDFKLFFFFI